jgi:hypothetical protein
MNSAAGCVIQSLSFIFLLATICAQLISFLTSHMIDNYNNFNIHEGVFQRCGPISSFPIGTFQANIGGMFGFIPECNWWNSKTFDLDPISLRAVTILALISFGLLGFVFMLGLLSLIERLAVRAVQVILGLLMMLNGELNQN